MATATTFLESRMSPESNVLAEPLVDLSMLSAAERAELVALGLLTPAGEQMVPRPALMRPRVPPVERRPITSLNVLNEAFAYAIPSSFSRGLRVPVGDVDLLFISGTASIDDQGRTVCLGDFRAQCWRTYRNITTLLESEGATWHDVIKTTCYLRDIERDYREFNRVRTAFFTWLQLDPLPASVGIQARLCREDLLVEIEGLAIIRKKS
jgi:enamine deaminase RidA (YjgF/YER057c/UK114 family)